jgi:MYXO-CTERM domain-containing protein
MQFRAPLLAITVLSVWAGDAFAQVTCDPATFEASCNADGTIKVCDDVTNAAAPVEDDLSCTEAFGVANDGACAATFGCVGNCPPDALTCEVPLDGNCVGFGPLTDQDPNNNDAAGTVMCQGDATCKLNNDGTDTCVAHIGPACTVGAESTCVGDTAVICLGDSANTFVLTSNIAIDCTLFDTTCGATPCECDEQCGDGGTCTNGTCDGGDFCIFPSDVTCPVGEGEGEGEGEEDDNGGRTRDEPEAAPSGCPFNASGSFPAFGALALAILGLRRRR